MKLLNSIDLIGQSSLMVGTITPGVYFVFIAIGALLADTVIDNVPVVFFVVVAVAAPASLALFYYMITFKTYRLSKVQVV